MRAKALEAGARAWLDGLPALVGELAGRWGLRVGRAFGDATEAYVVRVARSDGTPAVLKLLVPRGGGAGRQEIAVLRRAAGAGCARLLAADEAREALLIERLGPSMADLAVPQPRRLEILADLAAAVWRAGREPTGASAGASLLTGASGGVGLPAGASAGVGLPTGADKAEWLVAGIRRRWAALGEPCSRAAVDQAVAAARSRGRAHTPERAVLNHGDVHQWNALRCGDGFKLVDPDGLWAEPEHDLGVLLREDPVELMAGDPWDRARLLAARTGTGPAAIWEWGLAERVATGLALTAVGLQPVAADMLAAADRIARG